jgi:hypothetical protein
MSRPNLDTQIYTLKQFVQTAEHLQQADGDAFVDFVITGRNTVAEPPHQAVIDPLRGAGIRIDDSIEVLRDYDSALGPNPDIVVKCDIAVYPVSNPTDTLTTSIHIKYPIRRGNVSIPGKAHD